MSLTTTGVSCSSCGTQLSPNSKFCDQCAAPVAPVTRPAEYKQVTVLFADVVRWTRRLVAAGLGLTALAGAVAVGHTQPPPTPSPVPSIVDEPEPSAPPDWSDPDNEGGPTNQWGGFGVFCENQWVICQ